MKSLFAIWQVTRWVHRIDPDIFEVEVNEGLVHQAFVRQMANAHLGTHKVKTRSEVNERPPNGTGKKHWPRSSWGAFGPDLCRCWGVAHGPQPRSYAKQMPRRCATRRCAVRCPLWPPKADRGRG